MERRIKLSMASIALGLLVAGAVRRWAKEEGFTFFGEPPESAIVETHYETEVEYEARQTAALLAGDERTVAPAAARFPVGAVTNLDIAEPAPQESFLTAPQQAPAPPINGIPSAPSLEPTRPQVESQQTPPAPATAHGLYVIQPNDSFWRISQRVYGTGRYFQALYEYNRRDCPQPDRLPAGVTIQTPEPYLLERAFPDMFR
jgi:nucleoid-associated protein YgaU